MSAVVQAIGLLKTDGRVDLGGEYLDVLGERDPVGPRRGEGIFRGVALPKIYGRRWRPAVSRFVREGDQVIDVGCGFGNYTRHLAQAAGEGLTIGLDASEEMVAAATAGSDRQNLIYLRGDARALPFEEETFDVACSIDVIHMVEDPMVALKEMVRVLAPGGRLVVVTSCARKERQCGARAGVTTFGREELTGALHEHGLSSIEQKVIRRGQFVLAQKPGEGASNGN